MNAPGYGLDRARALVAGHTCVAAINDAKVLIDGKRYRFIAKTHSRHVAAPLRDAREPAEASSPPECLGGQHQGVK